MDCIHCHSTLVFKNGHTRSGKQNYGCNSCRRQFVEGGQAWFVDSKERLQIDKLLLERISLRGICRVMSVSLSWLLNYIKEVYDGLPDDLNVVEQLPNKEAYLDDRLEEEIYRIIREKKGSVSLSNYTEVADCCTLNEVEIFDNEHFIDTMEGGEPLEIGVEGDLLMDNLYSQERGLRVEFLGIQLDELWSFVGNKDNKKWVWIALNPDNRQIIAFHIGGRGSVDAGLFYEKIPTFFKENAAFFSDYWQAYVKTFSENDHFGVGKDSGLTAYIERFNCTLRQRVARLVRKTLSFSKSLVNHIGAIKYFICAYNLQIKTLQV